MWYIGLFISQICRWFRVCRFGIWPIIAHAIVGRPVMIRKPALLSQEHNANILPTLAPRCKNTAYLAPGTPQARC